MHVRPLALLLVASFLLGGALPGPPHANAKPAASIPADHERDAAILSGLRYLERTVFQLPEASGTPRKPFTVAATGLVFLLARDRQSGTSAGKKLVARARTYLTRYVAEVAERAAQASQLPAQSGQFSSDKLIQYTWPLAMDALFQSELDARKQEGARASRDLKALVPLLLEAQAPNGGWGHGKVGDRGRPKGSSSMDGFGSYPDTLQAATNLVAFSLGLAPKSAAVPSQALERARAYYRYAELANGNFPYDPSQRSAHRDLTGVSRAAGAALAMRALDIPWKDRGIVRALSYVDENFAYLSEGHGSSVHNLLLAAFLQRARGDKAWKQFKKTYFRRLLDQQEESGAFGCICEGKAFASTNDSKPFGGALAGAPGPFREATAAYVTALHTLILLLDRSPPRILSGEPGPAPAAPVTPTTSGG
jgi:hypothetical protein